MYRTIQLICQNFQYNSNEKTWSTFTAKVKDLDKTEGLSGLHRQTWRPFLNNLTAGKFPALSLLTKSATLCNQLMDSPSIEQAFNEVYGAHRFAFNTKEDFIKGVKVPLMRAITDSINWDFWTSVASFETLQTHKEGWNIERAQSIVPMDIMVLVHNHGGRTQHLLDTRRSKVYSPDRKFPKGHESPKKNNSSDLHPPAETRRRRVEEP
jgi:hypothetical protein